jgi:hypothetical protein
MSPLAIFITAQLVTSIGGILLFAALYLTVCHFIERKRFRVLSPADQDWQREDFIKHNKRRLPKYMRLA